MNYEILQISSGQGPAECRKFIPILAEIILKEAQKNDIVLFPLTEKTELMGSMRFLSAKPIPDTFKELWEGTIQWIWKSTIRPHHQRKNWFVKVSFIVSENMNVSEFKQDES